MKFARCLTVFVLFGSSLMLAQAPAAAPATAAADKNPVTTTVNRYFDRQKTNMIGAAEAMPADKYMFKPTEGHISFSQLMVHVAKANGFVCSRIGDLTAPKELDDLKEADGKDKIVAAVKQSLDFCGQALAKLDDSKLADQVQWRGDRKVPRAQAVVELPVDLADHYGAAATYLRLNGILPPSAQPRK
jgi:uncharacterized damage-inducible protein DinB